MEDPQALTEQLMAAVKMGVKLIKPLVSTQQTEAENLADRLIAHINKGKRRTAKPAERNGHRKVSDDDWNRIWAERFEDPTYYSQDKVSLLGSTLSRMHTMGFRRFGSNRGSSNGPDN